MREKSNSPVMRMIIAFMMTAMVAFALFGCGTDSGDDNRDTDRAGKAVAGVKYYHYDAEKFNKSCRRLSELAEAADEGDSPDGERTDKILKLYDSLYDECEEIQSLASVIYIKYSTNVANEYYQDEQVYTSNLQTECCDRFCRACRKITESSCAEAFRKHVGRDAFEDFADYDIMSKEEKKLSRRENKLVEKYYRKIEATSSVSVKYKGEKWTVEDILGERGSELSSTDYEAYSKLFDRLMAAMNKSVGDIYVQLVHIRDRLAEINGYESYADFADEEIYHRDYDREDIEGLYKDVRKLSRKYYSNVATSGYGECPEMNQDELIENLEKYSSRISKVAGDAAEAMIEDELYNIGDSQCRLEGAYTTYIDNTDSPYIVMTLDGTRDFAVLTHEFGHFIEDREGKISEVVVGERNVDLSEIASNGYEALMTHYYDDIFGNDSSEAVKYVAVELIGNVTDGCIMDEFQRKVYDNPDMTLDEINETYQDVMEEYMQKSEAGEYGNTWVFTSHNFDSPMYYISYCVSGLASLQIWNESLKNFDSAVSMWEEFIKIGDINRQYMEVIEETGLVKFTEPGAVNRICSKALKMSGQ